MCAGRVESMRVVSRSVVRVWICPSMVHAVFEVLDEVLVHGQRYGIWVEGYYDATGLVAAHARAAHLLLVAAPRRRWLEQPADGNRSSSDA